MFEDLIAKASASSPQGCGSVHLSPGRTLLVDGDGLAYYCAGNDETTPGEARANVIDKIKAAQRIVGAEIVKVLLTLSGSHKGHRYAIARVKPYQGQRTHSRRPRNWDALRVFLEDGTNKDFQVESTLTAEADDLFGKYAHADPSKVVIYTQDKDMRMLPGMHLDWVAHTVHTVGVGESSQHVGKQYGPRWFWLQMLQGDPADNIPGLPKYLARDTFEPVGEVTADKLLTTPMIREDRAQTVAAYYAGYYKERWLVEMLEQACLLWMRRDPDAWDDCTKPGGPMHVFASDPLYPPAYQEIQERVRTADLYNAGASQDDSSSPVPTAIAD